MTEEAEEKVQEFVSLVAIGEVPLDEADQILADAREKLDHLREMRGEA